MSHVDAVEIFDRLGLDEVIQLADRAMAEIEGSERSVRTLEVFRRWSSITYASRLAYRPAPILEDPDDKDVHDPSSFFIDNHVHRACPIYSMELRLAMFSLRKDLRTTNTCWLTQIDFAAEVDPEKWPLAVNRSVQVLRTSVTTSTPRKRLFGVKKLLKTSTRCFRIFRSS